MNKGFYGSHINTFREFSTLDLPCFTRETIYVCFSTYQGKGSAPKGKNLLPRGTNSFQWIQSLLLSPLKVYGFSLSILCLMRLK